MIARHCILLFNIWLVKVRRGMDKDRFWRDSVGYIIYPEAFADSNGDGIGDINGIISKLDYLKELGVNLLWICPLSTPRWMTTDTT